MTRLIPDLIGTAGLGLLAYGLWQISQPLACCVVGVILMTVGVLLARRQAKIADAGGEVSRAG